MNKPRVIWTNGQDRIVFDKTYQKQFRHTLDGWVDDKELPLEDYPWVLALIEDYDELLNNDPCEG